MASVWIFVAISFFVNIISWLFAALLETEVFYDLTGGITFVLLGAFSYWFRAKAPSGDDDQTRQAWATLMLLSWSLRLSGFLFARMLRDGDKRLEKYKTDPIAFLIPFTMQAVWCIMDSLPVLLLNNAGAGVPVGGTWDTLVLAGWLLGHGIELVADTQKWLFRSVKDNQKRFISSGLWAYSRHPNYFGQIVLQWCLMLFCLPGIWASAGWIGLAFAIVSPAFETFLLLRVSGVPLLEKHAKMKWGEDPAYRRYLESTALLIPWPPKSVPGGAKRRF